MLFKANLREKIYLDPLHGLISFDINTPQERILVALLDAPEFQRLRRIRQLGMAHMAFQGAEHSRFTHSIGVFALARRVLEQLSKLYAIDPAIAFVGEIAALLHDIGHGPFSHIIEKFLGRSHEDWGSDILLDPTTRIGQLLRAVDTQLPVHLAELYHGNFTPRYIVHIVSSQLDADRFDYLLRDSLMTGVKHGIFDLDRLIHMLRIDESGSRLVVSDRGVAPVEKYLQSRYHMYRQVYLHKTVVAAESMLLALLQRAALLAREGKLASVAKTHRLHRILAQTGQMTVADFLYLDDSLVSYFLKEWSEERDPTLADLSRRLLARDLFKTFDLPADTATQRQRLDEAREFLRSNGLDPEFYLLVAKSGDQPYKPYDTGNVRGDSAIHVEQSGPHGTSYIEIDRLSPTIRAFTESGYSVVRAVFPARANGRDLRGKMEEILAGASR